MNANKNRKVHRLHGFPRIFNFLYSSSVLIRVNPWIKKIRLLCVLCGFLIALTACFPNPPLPRYFPVTGVTLNQTSLTLNLWVGPGYDKRTAVLTASITPDNASFTGVRWHSSNPSVATVGEYDGVVRAVSPGTANITVTTDDGGKTAVCVVTVIFTTPQAVQSVSIDNLTLFIGGTEQKTLTPVFTPAVVLNETVTWETLNLNPAGNLLVKCEAFAKVNAQGVVTAVSPGTAIIRVTTEDGGQTASSTVTVTPLLAQFADFTAFLAAPFYRQNFFGTNPARTGGDTAANVSTWTGWNTNQADFALDYTFNNTLFGRAGAGNLVPEFIGTAGVQVSTIPRGPYRSCSQFNFASIPHFAFTWYRQAYPWGIDSLTVPPNRDGNDTTRAGHTWSSGAAVSAANPIQFSGLGVDLLADRLIDTVLIYAGANITSASRFNSPNGNIYNRSLGIIVEYMPHSTAAETAFDALGNGNWPPPGAPWVSMGKIVPDGNSSVFVFHLEEPVLARYVRASFQQAPVGGGNFTGLTFVNSFEVYNTRE